MATPISTRAVIFKQPAPSASTGPSTGAESSGVAGEFTVIAAVSEDEPPRDTDRSTSHPNDHYFDDHKGCIKFPSKMAIASPLRVLAWGPVQPCTHPFFHLSCLNL